MSDPPFQTDKGKILCLNVQEVAAFIADRYHDEKLYSIQATLSKILAHVYIDYIIIKITLSKISKVRFIQLDDQRVWMDQSSVESLPQNILCVCVGGGGGG